ALIFPAELPDKTFVATLVLSTRYPGWPVFVGIAAAFVVQTTVAVAAGGLISLLPPRPVHAFTALMFAIGAVLMLRSKSEAAEEEREVTAELAAERREQGDRSDQPPVCVVHRRSRRVERAHHAVAVPHPQQAADQAGAVVENREWCNSLRIVRRAGTGVEVDEVDQAEQPAPW